MQALQREVVIMALNTKDPAGELNLLHSLGFEAKQVEGVYKGVAEQSFIIICEKSDSWINFGILGIAFGQESILRVRSNGDASLIFLTNNDVTPLGKFEETTEEIAKAQDSYTFDRASNQYFTTTKG